MSDIINISNIHDYNEFLGIETLNPLVTFADFGLWSISGFTIGM